MHLSKHNRRSAVLALLTSLLVSTSLAQPRASETQGGTGSATRSHSASPMDSTIQADAPDQVGTGRSPGQDSQAGSKSVQAESAGTTRSGATSNEEGESASQAGLATNGAGQSELSGQDVLLPEGAVSLVYEAPAVCPRKLQLLARAERAVPERKFSNDPYAPLIILRITKEGDDYVGLHLPAGATNEAQGHTVRGNDCRVVFEALAHLVVLELSGRDSLGSDVGAVNSGDARPSEVRGASQPAVVDTSGSLTKRPSWIQRPGFHHEKETSDGQLRLDKVFAVDLQAGVIYGLLPGSAMPRLDLTVRSARFLTPPGERPFLIGFLPRMRATALIRTSAQTATGEEEVSGYTFAMGACYAPYYDPRGWVFLGCADGGGGILQTFQRIDAANAGFVRKVAVMRLGASIESEYNFGSVFHMAARIAYEANLPLNLPYRTDDGFQVFHPGKDSFVASLGVGLHF